MSFQKKKTSNFCSVVEPTEIAEEKKVAEIVEEKVDDTGDDLDEANIQLDIGDDEEGDVNTNIK